MSVRIEAAATAHARGLRFVHAGPLARGALHVIDAAARASLARAGRKPDEIDVLINTGLYKDRHLAEPALASMIQEDIGANRGGRPELGRHGTFSFDVMNGGCGVLTAAHLLDGLVGAGTARVGVIVAGDADPEPRRSRGFHFPAVGGALVLGNAPDDGGGFERFLFRTFPEDAELFESRVGWQPRSGLALAGHNVLAVREHVRYAERCVEHAVEVAGELLAEASLLPTDVDLLIASQRPAKFATLVGRRLGIRADRVPSVSRAIAGAHTAGPIAALEAAIASGAMASARHVLFVTAGAGITIGAALYATAPRTAPGPRARPRDPSA